MTEAEGSDPVNWTDHVRSALPILRWLPSYQATWVQSDFIAGVTLAAYAVPVSLAYAKLAGLPPQAGLYCYLLGGLAYAVFGTSKQLAIGPTSAISMLIGSTLGTLATADVARQAHLAMGVAILAGGLGLIAWVLRLGNVINFISETVLSGFKVGAGLVIASTQLPKLFGVASVGGNFFVRCIDLVRHVGETDLRTLTLGAAALALLVLGELLLPERPVALFVVVISIVFISLVPTAAEGVKTVGVIPRGLPSPGWPGVDWSEVDTLLPLAMACFLLSYVESISVVRTFALKHRYPVNPDQELLALGAANLVAGMGQGYPLAGGMSQSAVNEKGGAKTPLALVFASVCIGLVLLFLTGVMRNLPEPVLAAIVLMAVKGLINPSELRHLSHVSKMEFRLAMLAAVGVLMFGILKGVLLAAVFSILVLLKRASRPRIATLGQISGTDRFADCARYPDCEQVPRVLVLRIESGLFYFNAENVRLEILNRARLDPSVRLLVIDLSTSPNIDLAGSRMFADLHQELAHDSVSLKLAEVHGAVRDLLLAEKLNSKIEAIDQREEVAAMIRRWEMQGS
jgi:sulfate permease, SulP family